MAGIRKGDLPPIHGNSKVLTVSTTSTRPRTPSDASQDASTGSDDEPSQEASREELPESTPSGDDHESELENLPAGVSRHQVKDLKEAFDIFDQSGEGTITPAKLGNVMRSLGENPTEAEVQDLIIAVDDDGNGTIEFEEFVNMMSKKINEPTRDEDVGAVFKVFDRSGKGAVGVDDLSDVLGRLGWSDLTTEEIKAMIDVADGDQDDQVTLTDFIHLMKDDT